MTYQTIFDYTNQTGTKGLTGILTYVATAVPLFAPILLFSIFLIIMFGSYYSSIRTRGYGDLLGSFAVAGVITALLSIILYMIQPAVVDTLTVLVSIIVAIIGVVAIFTSNER